MSSPAPVRATWHGLTAPCRVCGDQVLSFRLEDGTTLRLTLAATEVAQLAGVCAQTFGPAYPTCRSHSSISSQVSS